MQIYRLIFVFLVIVLTGCDQDKIDDLTVRNELLEEQVLQLQNQNQEEKNKITKDYAKRKAEFDQFEYQAGITAGCRHFVNVCPASVTAPGDSAQKAGYSGGGTPIFWAIYFSKCSFVLSVFWLMLVSWKRLVRPTLHAQKHADMELDKTQKSIEQEKARLEKTQAATWQAEKNLKEAERKLEKKEAEIFEKDEQLAELNHDLKGAEAAKQALNSFKF